MTDKVEIINSVAEEEVEVLDDQVRSVLSGEINTTPENVVKMTQVIRTGILRKVTGHGTYLPSDEDGVALTLSILKDMDHTALTTSKLNIEEKKANSAAQIASIADSIISKMALGSAPPTPVDLGTNLLLPEVEIMDGEDDIGEHPLNPDEWLTDRE